MSSPIRSFIMFCSLSYSLSALSKKGSEGISSLPRDRSGLSVGGMSRCFHSRSIFGRMSSACARLLLHSSWRSSLSSISSGTMSIGTGSGNFFSGMYSFLRRRLICSGKSPTALRLSSSSLRSSRSLVSLGTASLASISSSVNTRGLISSSLRRSWISAARASASSRLLRFLLSSSISFCSITSASSASSSPSAKTRGSISSCLRSPCSSSMRGCRALRRSTLSRRPSRSSVRSSTLVGPTSSSSSHSLTGMSSCLRRSWISSHSGGICCRRSRS
mmetsp:Transcript_16408/g.23055  ORF Transcript_16408/g.23055 Transcript_16408/m.23055 type:complete len:275 (+) Transcript_16408:840-1664(+)